MATEDKDSPYADRLAAIAAAAPGDSSDGSLNWLISSAMNRLGYAAPNYAMVPPTPTYADGGSVEDHSSLKKFSNLLGHLGPGFQRYGVGVAKQFYGLDENGEPQFGGNLVGTPTAHGKWNAPPAIVDQLLSLPSSVAPLTHMLNKYTHAPFDVLGENGPQFSQNAAARLAALNKKVSDVTGVGDAHTLPEHLEDAAAMLTAPMPASKLAGEAPALQRMLEFLTPMRPPTLKRFATDTGLVGGIGSGLEALNQRLAAKSPPVAQTEDTQNAVQQ